jgi:TPR repeat protein
VVARVVETAGSDNPVPKADLAKQAGPSSPPYDATVRPIEDAAAAYNRGDYSTAMQIFRPLGVHGNPIAQLNIGLMYVKGQGVTRDLSIALIWFNSAAANSASDQATREDAIYNRDFIAKKLAKQNDEAPPSSVIAVNPRIEFSGAEGVLRDKCSNDWKDDFRMRAYCEQQQREAVQKLSNGSPTDVPPERFATVRRKCANDWPTDYKMRAYCEGQQYAAIRQLGNR